jgi:hypothetical protein
MGARAAVYEFLDNGRVDGRAAGAHRGLIPNFSCICSRIPGAGGDKAARADLRTVLAHAVLDPQAASALLYAI